MQLRHQLTLTSCTAWIVVLGLLYIIVSERLLHDAHKSAELRLTSATSEAVRSLEALFRERRGDLTVLDQILDQVPNDREHATNILTTIRDAYGSYEWLRLIDSDGVVIADTNQMGIGTRPDPPGGNGSAFTVTLHLATLQQDIHALISLRSTKRQLIASVPLQRVQRTLIDPRYWPPGTRTELIAGRVVVASTDPSLIGKAPASLPSDAFSQKIDDGTLILSAITNEGWEFRSAVAAADWQRPMRPILNAILIAAAVGACGGSLLVGWMTVRITRPLAKLAEDAASSAPAACVRFHEKTPGEPTEVAQLRSVLATMELELRQRIHALQEAGERMRLAAQFARLGVWNYQFESGNLHWDDGMLSIYGCERRNLHGVIEDWSSRLLPEDLPGAQVIFSACIQERTQRRLRFRIRRDDGVIRWIDAVIEPILDAQGLVTAAFGINLDNTEYVEAEEALRTSLRAAEAATQAKGEFLATMSHEIRTPLNGVIGMIDLLLASSLSAQQQDMARTIHDSGTTLLGIVNDILDFSKIEAGKLTLEQHPYDPALAIRDVIALLQPQAYDKQLQMEFIASGQLPLALLGDAGRFRQVLFNLLGNALKFTTHGHVRVQLSQHGRSCIITVQDTGIGIAADDLGKLFRRFSQVDASMTRRFGGTGLGLAICQRLMVAMGGTITVDSIVGQGSTFTIVLPLPDQPLVVPAQAEAKPSVASARALRVLLAEDNLVNQKVASSMLTRLGHRCEIAENGKTAVSAWRRGGFDLILMDMQMPEMDGLEATRIIRSEEIAPQRIPIVALTANAMESDRAACFAAGMVGVIAKPITSASLAQALREFGPA